MNAPFSSEEMAERISCLIDRSRAFQKTLAGPDEQAVGRIIGLLCKALDELQGRIDTQQKNKPEEND